MMVSVGAVDIRKRLNKPLFLPHHLFISELTGSQSTLLYSTLVGLTYGNCDDEGGGGGGGQTGSGWMMIWW